MKVTQLLERLERVRPSGPGWVAQCPAHDDRQPSLSIHEGEKGLLVRCWAGCQLSQICSALGLAIADLFYESCNQGRDARRPLKQNDLWTSKPLDWRIYSHQVLSLAEGYFLRSEAVLSAAKNVSISDWPDEDLDTALNAVANGYEDMALTDKLADLACNLRGYGLEQEQNERNQREKNSRAA